MKVLFGECQQKDAAERQTFLDEACRGDNALRDKVETLLADAESAGSFLERPLVSLPERKVFSPVAEGESVSHYRILEKIGEGGMGVVYKAEDTKLGRTVALKFLAANLVSDDEGRRRFLREAKAAASLDHPNICTVHEIDEVDGNTFIAMAFLDGRELADEIKAGPLKIERLLDIAVQAAQGLAEAHGKGVSHRDIKPANVMLTSGGRAVVTDFGLAQWSVSDSRITKEGTTLGTVAYMSPQQAEGVKVDHRTDIWSLGVVLYEMVTGRLPFRGDYEQVIVYSLLNEQPEAITGVRSGVPMELERIVNKCLEKSPDERYQRVEELLVDLRAVRRQLTSDTGLASRGSRRASRTAGPPLSVAVLPFVNLSRDDEDEYFSDGITEDILNRLARVEGLRVPGRSSTFLFKGSNPDLRDVAEKLNVGLVLEGSVRRSGKRLRITAQLTSIDDGYQIWSERYDRIVEDLFDIQDELSLAIVDKLKVNLATSGGQALVKRPTDSLEAYDLLLKGRYEWRKLTAPGIKAAITHLERAKQEDPNFAEPYAELAYAYGVLTIRGWASPRELVPRVEAEARQALEIDDSLAEAHNASGEYHFWGRWDWAGAEREYKRAIELNPRYAQAHESYSRFLYYTGSMDKALVEARKALEIEPLSPQTAELLAEEYCQAGQYHQALEECRKGLDMDPNWFTIYVVLGAAQMGTGAYEDALKSFEKGSLLGHGDPIAQAFLGWAYGVTGRKDKALEVLAELERRRAQGYLSGVVLAMVAIGISEKDQAFQPGFPFWPWHGHSIHPLRSEQHVLSR